MYTFLYYLCVTFVYGFHMGFSKCHQIRSYFIDQAKQYEPLHQKVITLQNTTLTTSSESYYSNYIRNFFTNVDHFIFKNTCNKATQN